MRPCQNCHHAPIPKRNRRYCRKCSPLASRLWKARHRRLWAQAWRRGGRTGPAPYLDGWENREAFRAYYRAYMRAWRKRKRERTPGTDCTARTAERRAA